MLKFHQINLFYLTKLDFSNKLTNINTENTYKNHIK